MHQGSALEIPKVDWLDRSENPDKFFKDLTYALSRFWLHGVDQCAWPSG